MIQIKDILSTYVLILESKIPSRLFGKYRSARKQEVRVSRKKILIIEDEKTLALVLSRKLGTEGFHVTVGDNGQQCLDLIAEEHFDVLLLDLIMPVMDGFEVLEVLQTVEKRPAIVVMSNLSQEEDKQRALDMGAEHYLIKSNVQLAEIVVLVEKL